MDLAESLRQRAQDMRLRGDVAPPAWLERARCVLLHEEFTGP